MRTIWGPHVCKAWRLLSMALPLLSSLLIAQAAYADVRINAGGAAYTDSSSNLWSADTGFNGGSSVDWGPVAISGTNDPTLYRTEHYGAGLTYTVAVPNGTYTVRLHFAENWVDSTFPNAGIGFRVFNVQANSVTIVPNLDLYATAGAHVAVVKTATVTVSNGQIVFSSSSAGWMVNAIEVIGQGTSPVADTTPPTVPTGVALGFGSNGQTFVSWNASTDSGTGVGGYHVFRSGVLIGTSTVNSFEDDNYLGPFPVLPVPYTVSAFDQAVPPNESAQSSPACKTPGHIVQVSCTSNPTTAVRINAGGPAYTDSSGNLWSADTGFNGGGAVNWGPVSIAGANDPTLYRTEHYGPGLTYTVAVPNGTYTVRLHFAENWVDSTFPNAGIGYRVFDVRANGVTIVPNLDLYATAGAHTAVVKTATVTVANGQIVFSSSAAGWMVNAIEVVGQGGTTATPPTAPRAIIVKATGGTNVNLVFSESDPGSVGYRIYRNGVAVATTLGTQEYDLYPPTFVWIDQGLTPGATYAYDVTAYSLADPTSESAHSNVLTITMPNFRVPTVPINLTGSAVSYGVALSWGASTFFGDGSNSGYYIYRNGTLILNASGTSFVDTFGLSPSTTYTYVVTAYDTSATPIESAPSNSVSVTTPALITIVPPTAPTHLNATVLSSTSVQISWGASTYYGNGIRGYNLYRNGVLFNSLVGASSPTQFTDTGLSPSTTYKYVVTAFDYSSTPNESAPSNSASVTTFPGAGLTHIRINAGGFGYTDSSNNTWTADSVATGGSSVDWGAHAVAGTNDPILFRTEAYGQNLKYTLGVPNGNYTVKLYFCENWIDAAFPNGGIGYRVFSVLANGASIVSNLDVFATVGRNVALVKTATVSVTNGQLVLSSPGGWMINAIELIGQ